LHRQQRPTWPECSGIQANRLSTEDAPLGVVPPPQRLEHRLQTPAAIPIILLFALVNAGIPPDLDTLSSAGRIGRYLPPG
jgi:hypothetical protein